MRNKNIQKEKKNPDGAVVKIKSKAPWSAVDSRFFVVKGVYVSNNWTWLENVLQGWAPTKAGFMQ